MADPSARALFATTATFSDDRFRIPVNAPKYQYLVCDLLTDQLQANLPLTGVTFDTRVSRVGDFKAQWRISNRKQAILAEQISQGSGRFTLWILRNKRLWWGGILWSAKGSATSRSYDTVDLQGATFGSYPHHRYIDGDWPADFITDTAQKVQNIWTSMQAVHARSNIHAISSTPANLSGAAFGQEFLQSDLKTYGDMIEAQTDSDPGCDFVIAVYTDANGNRIKEVRTAGTFKTIPTANRLAISGYRVPAWEFTRDGSIAGTRFRAWGDVQDGNSGEAQAPVSSAIKTADDLLTTGWPYLDVAVNVGAVPAGAANYGPVLDSYAQALKNQYAGIRDVVGYEVDLGTSEWHPNLIGQNVLIKFSKNDLWRPGQTSVITPVIAEFTPPDQGQPERVKFTIDGAEVS
jgi:hypothetical protein